MVIMSKRRGLFGGGPRRPQNLYSVSLESVLSVLWDQSPQVSRPRSVRPAFRIRTWDNALKGTVLPESSLTHAPGVHTFTVPTSGGGPFVPVPPTPPELGTSPRTRRSRPSSRPSSLQVRTPGCPPLLRQTPGLSSGSPTPHPLDPGTETEWEPVPRCKYEPGAGRTRPFRSRTGTPFPGRYGPRSPPGGREAEER